MRPCRAGGGSLNRSLPGIRSLCRLDRSVDCPRHHLAVSPLPNILCRPSTTVHRELLRRPGGALLGRQWSAMLTATGCLLRAGACSNSPLPESFYRQRLFFARFTGPRAGDYGTLVTGAAGLACPHQAQACLLHFGRCRKSHLRRRLAPRPKTQPPPSGCFSWIPRQLTPCRAGEEGRSAAGCLSTLAAGPPADRAPASGEGKGGTGSRFNSYPGS